MITAFRESRPPAVSSSRTYRRIPTIERLSCNPSTDDPANTAADAGNVNGHSTWLDTVLARCSTDPVCDSQTARIFTTEDAERQHRHQREILIDRRSVSSDARYETGERGQGDFKVSFDKVARR
jgi:hypothetical protein